MYNLASYGGRGVIALQGVQLAQQHLLRAPLQRAADASERTQRLLTAAEEKQKMLEQLLEELK